MKEQPKSFELYTRVMGPNWNWTLHSEYPSLKEGEVAAEKIRSGNRHIQTRIRDDDGIEVHFSIATAEQIDCPVIC